MYYSISMAISNSRKHLDENSAGLAFFHHRLRRIRLGSIQGLKQVALGCIFGDNEPFVLLIEGLIDLNDVWMVELAEQFYLLFGPLEAFFRLLVLFDDLQSHKHARL